jgi:hypothetical protein
MSEKEVKVECTAEIMMRLQKSHVVVAAAILLLCTQTEWLLNNHGKLLPCHSFAFTPDEFLAQKLGESARTLDAICIRSFSLKPVLINLNDRSGCQCW